VLSGIIVAATFAYENKFEEIRQQAGASTDGAADEPSLIAKPGERNRSA